MRTASAARAAPSLLSASEISAPAASPRLQNRRECSASHRTEEMKRTRKIPQQETNRNQVEKYAERPRNSVMGIAPLAVHVANGHFYNRRPVPGSQRRNEAVQLTI